MQKEDCLAEPGKNLVCDAGSGEQGQESEYAAGGQPHDDAAGDYAQGDGTEGRAQFHLQQGGDEAAGPCAGSRQWNRHKDIEPQQFIAAQLADLAVADVDNFQNSTRRAKTTRMGTGRILPMTEIR